MFKNIFTSLLALLIISGVTLAYTSITTIPTKNNTETVDETEWNQLVTGINTLHDNVEEINSTQMNMENDILSYLQSSECQIISNRIVCSEFVWSMTTNNYFLSWDGVDTEDDGRADTCVLTTSPSIIGSKVSVAPSGSCTTAGLKKYIVISQNDVCELEDEVSYYDIDVDYRVSIYTCG